MQKRIRDPLFSEDVKIAFLFYFIYIYIYTYKILILILIYNKNHSNFLDTDNYIYLFEVKYFS